MTFVVVLADICFSVAEKVSLVGNKQLFSLEALVSLFFLFTFNSLFLYLIKLQSCRLRSPRPRLESGRPKFLVMLPGRNVECRRLMNWKNIVSEAEEVTESNISRGLFIKHFF